MTNELQIFENNQFGQVRAIMKDGEPWFVAADVCRALEIANNRDALTRLEQDEKGVALTDTPGGAQEVTIVNEPGLYTLVLGSRKPEAKAFKRWVTHEVIPSIRKHGMYATPTTIEQMIADPANAIKVFSALKQEQERRKELEATVEHNAPKVLFADAVAASHTSILIGDLAKLIRQNGVEVGQNRLFQWLRDNGYLCSTGEWYNLPTQKSMELKLFEVKETTISNPDGSIRITRTTKVTGKGQAYFVNKFLAKVS